MPVSRSHRVYRLRHKRQHVRGFMDFIGKVGSFLKSSKLVSTVANGLSSAGVPYAGAIGSAAGALGYGRKRRGKGLGLAGMGRRRHR